MQLPYYYPSGPPPLYAAPTPLYEYQAPPAKKPENHPLKWKIAAVVCLLATIGFAAGFLYYFEDSDDVSPNTASLRLRDEHTTSSIIMLSIGTVVSLAALAIGDRSLLMLAVACMFTVAGRYSPYYSGWVAQNALAICTSFSALLTTLMLWFTSESIQDNSDTDGDGKIDEGEARAGQIVYIPVPLMRMISIALGLFYIACHITLIIVSQLQDYALDAFDTWNITTGCAGMFTGLLLVIGSVRYMRGILMLTAVWGLLIVNLYATWITAVMNTDGGLRANCDDPTYFEYTTKCTDRGLVTAELAFNWGNWGLSLLVIWASSYLSEQLQNYERAEELGIDRNLSDPFTLCGKKIQSPINLSRGIMLVVYVLLFTLACIFIVLGVIIDESGGYPRALWIGPRNDLMFIVPYMFVAIVTGLVGIALANRRWLIASLIWLTWCLGYSFGLAFSSIFVLIDGYQSVSLFNPIVPVTGWLHTAVAIAIFCSLSTLVLSLLGGMVIWILNEAMQDKVLFAAQHAGKADHQDSPVYSDAPVMYGSYPSPYYGPGLYTTPQY